MAKSTDLGDYLARPGHGDHLAPFDAMGRQRITQLINKTNQFNLTTRRYTEAEVLAMESDPALFTLQVRLKDKFGDLGMIGVVIGRPAAHDAQTWDIDTWLMSCRVLGRHVEQAMLAKVVAEAQKRGIRRIVGTYIPTPKNAMVADHFGKLGFDRTSSADNGLTVWELRCTDFVFPTLPMTVFEQPAKASGASATSAAGDGPEDAQLSPQSQTTPHAATAQLNSASAGL